MKKYLLVTGATGFIGQYVLRRLLLKDVPVVCIGRASGELSAKDRILNIVKQFEVEEGRELPKPIVFTGNLHSEMLGLDDNALDWFEQNCKAVLHNAASIRFHAPDGDKTKDPYLSNVQGCQNVLDLCKFAGIEEFHHVSTAYVCGARTDLCKETELDVGQEFVNDYQVSKCEAEKMSRSADYIKSLTVYRPGLVVGDSRTGFTTNPDFGLYHYIQLNTHIIKGLREAGAEGTINLPMRLRFTGEERRNIVTVDWVADAMVHLITNPELHGETYHLTPEIQITSRQITEGLAKYFDYEGIEFVGHEVPEEERTEFEKMFYDFASTFEAYWEEEPTFDRTNTSRVMNDVFPTPPIDEECLEKLIRFAVEECFAT